MDATCIMQLGLIGFILVLHYSLVNGICSFPCVWQNRRYFGLSDGSDNTITCQQSSLYTAVTSDGQTVISECYAQSGPFLVTKIQNTNQYKCLRETFFDKNADIIFIYVTPFRRYKKNPSICDVCHGFESNPNLYVGENVKLNKYDTMKLKYSGK
ncbi:uncharacterized protein LOC143046478 [Mytilus galloprovincialis]|uniref:uncharacterized protein LOC143046478 n=1 Tax=Mytilus galloprovincialis TaxID=29158 RepID=UPI003F7C187C